MRKNFEIRSAVAPLPVLVIASYNNDGSANAMTCSWAGVYDGGKVFISIANKRRTFENIKERMAFTISYADVSHIKEADYFGIKSGYEEDKIAKSGVKIAKSEFVNAPIILDFPITVECQVEKIESIGEGRSSIIGTVKNLSANENVLDENGKISLSKAELISYDSFLKTYRKVDECVGKAYSDGYEIINK